MEANRAIKCATSITRTTNIKLSEMVQNKSVIFNEIPHGEPKLDQTLKVKSDEFDTQQDIADGSVLLKVITLSIDPYQRGRMRAPDSESYVPPFYVGQPIQNHGVARVLKSKNAAFKEGALVYGGLPFSEYMVLNEQFAQGLKDVSDSGIAPETLVGACGMPGRTAYMSFYHVGQPKAGQSIYVSAGAGAVGALVIQYAKKTGLKVGNLLLSWIDSLTRTKRSSLVLVQLKRLNYVAKSVQTLPSTTKSQAQRRKSRSSAVSTFSTTMLVVKCLMVSALGGKF